MKRFIFAKLIIKDFKKGVFELSEIELGLGKTHQKIYFGPAKIGFFLLSETQKLDS